MKTKTFEFDNLSPNDVIVVTSKDNIIDFSSESTRFTAYFNDSKGYNYDYHAELLISDNNQRFTTLFELPVWGKKMKLIIQTANYDVELLVVAKRS
jgi:hypothetical protein